jgi:sulfate transport system substrate-binding protein
VVGRNVAPSNREAVDAFVDFLWSDAAQRLFVANGFRSVDERHNAARADFGRIEDGFLVADLGGWAEARRSIIEGTWKAEVLPEVGR